MALAITLGLVALSGSAGEQPFAPGDLLPARIGEFSLANAAATPDGQRGDYIREGARQARLVVGAPSDVECNSTASARASRTRVNGHLACVFMATESDPHIAPYELTWSAHGHRIWFALTPAGFHDRVAATRRAEKAALAADRWFQRRSSSLRRPEAGSPANPAEAPGNVADAQTCAIGWMQIPAGVCVRFSKLEQSDDLRSDMVAMDLVSKTGYVHLNLRIAVLRGAREWCAYPAVLSLYKIEANRQYAFRIPCSRSGTPMDSGELRLVVEVDEAIEMPRSR